MRSDQHGVRARQKGNTHGLRWWSSRVSRLKVLTAVTLAASVAVGSMIATPLPAQAAPLEIEIDGMQFRADSTDPDRSATLMSCPTSVPSGVLEIPTNLDFGENLPYYTVHKIAPGACKQVGLTSVTLPLFVHEIGDNAFFGNMLTSIDLPWPVEHIGAFAFAQNKLQSLDLTQARLDFIGESAFRNNEISGSITLSSRIESLGRYAFSGNKISAVDFPSSMKTIPNGLFDRNNLTEVTLPSSTVTVEPWAFGNNSISKLTLPNSLKNLEAVAFPFNDLTEVTVPASVEILQNGVFAANPNLTKITLEGNAPQGIKAAGDDGSFGPAAGKTVHIHRDATGYPAPPSLWHGYSLQYLESYVSFDSQGGSNVPRATVGYGQPVQIPTPPSRSGYEFTGWFTNQQATTAYDFANPVTDNLTLYAGWKLSTYSVSFDSRGGSAVPAATVDHGKAVSAPADPMQDGFSFEGWFTDKEAKVKYDFATPVTQSLTLYASWKANTYDVSFDSQGGSAVASVVAEHGKPVSTPADPTRANYGFAGWFTDKQATNAYDFATPVTGALTLYAGWTLNTYDVTFDSQGGSAVAATTVDHGKPVAEPAQPTREGHTFTGWHTDPNANENNTYDFSTPVTGKLTLYAAWKIDTYEVTFDSQGGTAVAATTVDHGKIVGEPAQPTREGYGFAGWFTDKQATTGYDFATPVTGNLTLYAGWTLNTYDVTFDSQGGSAVAATTVDHGKPVAEPAQPTREGHTFTGWHTDPNANENNTYDFSTPVTGKLTLYAAWKIDTYEVTFDSQGGSTVKPKTIEHGSAITAPADPTREGHTFTGWYTDASANTEYDFSNAVTAPVTLYAGWSIDSYEISFASHGGSEVTTVTIAYGDLLSEPSAPTREHHSFTGWFTDAAATNAYDFSSPITGPLSLHAGWKIDSFAITFDTRGGSATASDSVDYGSHLVIPSTPRKDGHVFTGWFTDEAATVKYDFTAPVTAPFTLYAGWKPIDGGAGANGGNANGQGNATGTLPGRPGGLTNTGSTEVPMGVFIGIGALVLAGAALAFFGLRKRKQQTDDVNEDAESL